MTGSDQSVASLSSPARSKSRAYLLAAASAIAVGCIGAAPSARAQPSAPQSMTFDVPILINDVLAGDIRVQISGTEAAVETPTLLALLLPRLREGDGDALAVVADGVGEYFDLTELTGFGYEASFSMTSVEVAVHVPFENLAPVSLGRSRAPPTEEAIQRRADISAYITARFGQRLNIDNNGVGETREPLIGQFAGAIRLFGSDGVTFDWRASYREGDERPVDRGDLRLIYDNEGNATRWQLGDLRYLTEGRQNNVAIAGLSFSRQFSIRPYELQRARGRRGIDLERPSTVEVLINGLTSNTFRLDPGRYTIDDLALNAATNDIEIIIRDDAGLEELIGFTQFFDNTLLDAGLHEFSYALGVKSNIIDGRYIYAKDEPVFSFFHNVGLADNFTFGINGQIDSDRFVAGFTSVLASPVGAFNVNFQQSGGDNSGAGYAADVNYRLPVGEIFGLKDRVTFNFAVEYTSEEFAAIDVTRINNEAIALASFRTNIDLTPTIGATIAASREWLRFEDEDRFDVRTSLQKRFGSGGSFRVDGEVGDGPEGFEWRVGARLNLLIGRNYRTQFSYDSNRNAVRAELRRLAARRAGQLGFGIGIERTDESAAVTGELAYAHNRFEFNGRTELVTDEAGRDKTQTATLNFATSLVFADGHFGVARPVSDSFVILSRHETLKNSRLVVQPSESGPIAQSDFLGGPVIPNLTAYSVDEIDFEVEDLPIGYDLAGAAFDFSTTFRSGAIEQVGSAASVSAIGTAIGLDGAAFSFAPGEIMPLDEESASKPQQIFTNATGRFAAPNLQAGAYRISFSVDGKNFESVFTIEPDAIGLVRLGELAFARAAGED